VSVLRGTENSNPPPSSGESTTNQVLRARGRRGRRERCSSQQLKERRKPPPVKTVWARGSMEWAAEQEKAQSTAAPDPVPHTRRVSSGSSSPCFQLPGTKRQPRRAGFVTARLLALFFATRLFKPSRAAFSAQPPAGAGCTGSYWSGSGRPTAAPILAPWPGITVCLSPQLLPARPGNELI
jgi:hypothetical protein